MRRLFTRNRVAVGLPIALTAALTAAAVVFATGVGSAATAKCVKFALVEAGLGSPLPNDNLDPGGTASTYAYQIAYNRLAVPDNSFDPKPELATSWKSNAKATVWTFNLRKGVKFHDGRELTAADVVYSYKRFWSDKKRYAFPLSLLDAFLKPSGIVATGRYTVQFRLFKPVAEFPYLANTNPMHIVQRGTTTKQYSSKDAGTGPFIAQKFKPGKLPYRFVKNPNYWEAGLPKAGCVDFYLVQEEASRAAALQTGQVDVVQALGFATLPQLRNNSKVKLQVAPPGLSLSLFIWTDTAPFDDNRVRTALKKAIDRKRLVNTLLLGYGIVGDDNPVPPTSAYAWRKTVPPQDIDGAKQLLQQAGYGPGNPLKVDLYTAEALPNMLQVAQAIAQDASKVGIQINVVTTPASEYWDKVYRFHSFGTSGWNPRPPGEALSLVYADTRANDPLGNETHWYKPEFEAAVSAARATIDPKARLAKYKALLRQLTLEGGDIRPVFVRNVAGIRSNCSGYVPSIVFSRIEVLKNTSCK